jgi:hypothetical protein
LRRPLLDRSVIDFGHPRASGEKSANRNGNERAHY